VFLTDEELAALRAAGFPVARHQVKPTDATPPPVLHPAVEALRKLDIDSLSPIEALTKLYELKRMALK
jgi:hypothetical protein